MISTTQARCVLAVARRGSFRGAARDLILSQSAISGHVAALERQLGGRVFDRTRLGATLSDRGRTLIPLLQAYLASHDEIARRILDHWETRASALRVVSHRPGVVLELPPLLATLRDTLGDTEVEVVAMEQIEDTAELIRSGSADVGLALRFADEPNTDDTIEEVEVAACSVGAYMAYWHHLATRASLALSDLAGEAIVQLRGQRSRELTEAIIGDRPPPTVYTVADAQAAMAMVAAGAGIALLPDSLAALAGDGVAHVPVPQIRPLVATILRRRRRGANEAAETLWSLMLSADEARR